MEREFFSVIFFFSKKREITASLDANDPVEGKTLKMQESCWNIAPRWGGMEPRIQVEGVALDGNKDGLQGRREARGYRKRCWQVSSLQKLFF